MKEKRKQSQQAEVRKSVMSDMRRLANLYLHMKASEETLGKLPTDDGNIGDIFKRNNFRHLEEALNTCTTVEDSDSTKDGRSLKAGLKMGLYYLLKASSKILKGLNLIEDNDEGDRKAEEIDKFISVLELNYNMIFGDAMYALHQSRQDKLRRPESAPNEDDVRRVRDYTAAQIRQLLSERYAFPDLHHYTSLRNNVVCRLTLFNARRGGEPSRC